MNQTDAASKSTETLVVSVILPCYNEEKSVEHTLEVVSAALAAVPRHEIIVVNDGSTDGSAAVLDRMIDRFPGLRVITHEQNRGYGAALKTGIRRANGELIAITDADGTYPNERLAELIGLCRDRDMVVGARTGPNVTYSKLRAFPKWFLRAWVSWIARRRVPDINSGMRVFRRDVVSKFFGILPDSFSFTITITLAMLTTSHLVDFVPIDYSARVGNSKIKPIRDTLRFIKIILRTGVYFAPMRAFMPLFALLAVMTAASLGHDVLVLRDLTERSLLLFLSLINTGMFMLIADMIDRRTTQW
jgi:glycosyltransferase involved in cell wall biosynthesis